MEDGLESLLRTRTRYELMLETMQRAHDVFDKEDMQPVENRLADLDSAIEQVREKLHKKDFIMEHAVKKLQHVLQTRQQILEEIDQQTALFSLDEELLNHLAARQIQLKQKLDLLMRKAEQL